MTSRTVVHMMRGMKVTAFSCYSSEWFECSMPVIKYLAVGNLHSHGLKVVPTVFTLALGSLVADVLHCFLHFFGRYTPC